MTYTRRTSKTLAVLLLGAMTAGVATGEDSDTREQCVQQAEEELRQIETGFKPGYEAILLRNVQLKAGSETFGTVAKGEKVVVEQIQGKWLWVKSGQTRGWVDKEAVMVTTLWDWYTRLSDNKLISTGRGVRAKFKGVWFDVPGKGRWPAQFIDNPIQVNGRLLLSSPVLVLGDDASFTLDEAGREWLLSVTFVRQNSPAMLERIPLALKSLGRYGAVQSGDFVQIDVKQRHVYVNGQLRRART
jgi:hypothetical protein